MSRIDWKATKQKDVEIYYFLTGRISEHNATEKFALAEKYQVTLDALMDVWAERYNMPFICVVADLAMAEIEETVSA